MSEEHIEFMVTYKEGVKFMDALKASSKLAQQFTHSSTLTQSCKGNDTGCTTYNMDGTIENTEPLNAIRSFIDNHQDIIQSHELRTYQPCAPQQV